MKFVRNLLQKKRYTFYILLSLLFFLIPLLFFTFFIIQSTPGKSLPGIVISFTKPSLLRIGHVFVIMEENKDFDTILKSESPYIHTLLKTGAFATQYRSVDPSLGSLHPSNPNYIVLEAGTNSFANHTFINDDSPSKENSTSSPLHLVTLLGKRGYSWKSYQEDITGTDCPLVIHDMYTPKHNPFIYFQDVVGNPADQTNVFCKKHIRPMEELQKDLRQGTVANYNFITPNLINDMHDGTIQQADRWLSTVVATITSSSVFKKDGVLFIVWDESEEESNNTIGFLILSPFVKSNYHDDTNYSHASFVKTVEEIFSLTPLLGHAADRSVKDFSSFFK